MFKSLARSQAVRVEIVQGGRERMGLVLGLCRGRKQGQIVEPCGDPTRGVSAGLELG